jgi:outer membrane lipase/esterase
VAAAAWLAFSMQAAAQEPEPEPEPEPEFPEEEFPDRILGPGLVGSSISYLNSIERAAAEANDLVYRTLEPECNPEGVLDQSPFPSFGDVSDRLPPGSMCNADTFFVYLNARELSHTANELQGQGPTVASLGLDQEGLGLALRWTAAEELAAQGSMATDFANSQLSSLAARISALRFGATGFGVAALYESVRRSSPLLAQVGGEAAAAESPRETYSPWGGFLNYGFGYGSKAPTALENAFDFDGSEVTIGVDYRLRNNVILGGILGYTKQKVDFDPSASAISVVDGDMRSDGMSFTVFALRQGERLTISGSVGMQSLDYEIERNIKYPSFNPNLPSVLSAAISKPEADVFTATFGVGYAFSWNKLSLEPFLNFEHVDVDIGAFSEQRSLNLLSNTDVSRRFDLAVSEQRIKSQKTSVGVRFQYVVTPRFGVIIPYWSLTAYREHKDESRTITSGYAALEPILGRNTFVLPTDPRDSSYYSASAGFSTVLRGGRQRDFGGPIMGGLMGFLQFATVRNRTHYDDRVITGGLRYEF